jgi:ABC-type sugar transport system permease subunit
MATSVAVHAHAKLKPKDSGGMLARSGNRTGLLYLLPAVLVVGALLYVPFFYTVYLSLTNSRGGRKISFIGLDNYVDFLQSATFFDSIVNTFLWVIGTILLPVGIGLLVAVLTYDTKRASLMRLPFMLPYTLSGAAIGLVFGFILQKDGALGQALGALHLPGAHTSWMLTAPRNTVMMVIATTWQAVGVNTLLFVVGLQSIPRAPLEAARIDGASSWDMFRYVVWPLLVPLTTVVVGLAIVASLKTFDIVWVMTQGGPGRSSETVGVTMYRETFVAEKYGYGSAVAVVLCIIAAAASVLYLRRQLRRTP